MADVKISALTDGTPAQATDEVPARRAGGNVKLALSAILTYVQGALSIAQSQVSGLVAALAALTAADSAEASTRASADTTLQTNITAEASARSTADSTHAGLTTSVHGIADTSKLRATGRTTFSDANITLTAADLYAEQIGTLSAPRTVTLPAASAMRPGDEIIVADASGSVTDVNTLTIQRAGSDTINGFTSRAIRTPNGALRLICDGTSKWTITNLLPIPITSFMLLFNNTAMAAGTNTILQSGSMESPGILIDLTNATQIRALVHLAGVAGSDATLQGRLQYSTTGIFGTFAYFDGVSEPSVPMSASGAYAGNWCVIPAVARGPVTIRAVSFSAAGGFTIRVPWFGFQVR